MSGELQRGPDISVMLEVWQRIEWSDGTSKGWHPREIAHSSIESARDLIAVLPTVIPCSMMAPSGMITYRIRQAITILEWLE
jgi:hypothetical protein